VDDAPAPLAAGFAPASEGDWLALVEKTLAGKPLSGLTRTTPEGVEIRPLYTPGETSPAAIALSPREGDRAWDVRTLIAHPDFAQANADALADLEGGAASLVLKIDPSGEAGVAIGSPDALEHTLAGVILELAPVALDAGFLGPHAADWLAAAAKRAPGAPLAFHLDPLSAFAEAGASPGPVESHLVKAATAAARLTETYPAASLFLASGRVAHEAGGRPAQELAVMAASLVAYAKALTRAGLTAPDAFARIVLGLSADADVFVTLAKLRAARLIHARIAQVCGAPGPARIEVRSSRRMLAAADPWTNMLRLTAAGFAAAAGGADAIVLGAFTDAIGHPTAFARRQSRNAQLVLMEEAHAGRVADPAAGAYALEALTDQLARAGWAALQAIEAQGGIIAALASGQIAADIAQGREARAAALAAGDAKILGVTLFPPTDPAPAQTAEGRAAPADAPSPRLPGPDGRCLPLIPVRDAEAFEAAQ
jgi:methylmalonyl-CoA mutase